MDIRGRNKVNPNFNMSSMTDIVFLLLIFFIITSSFVSPHAIDLLLPKGEGQVIQGGEPISVSISADGRYYINETEITSEEVEEALFLKFQNTAEEDRTLTIRAEQGVPIEKVVTVLSIANKNKYKTVLATQPVE
ncbi:biopolymer transport protein exbD2 [Flavobacteriaceae bacterium UJ101]|nr:biopolymer transport protein exbD2 [Flavobacteriaceae bacterium UJ101]